MVASDALIVDDDAALRELVLQFESLGGAGHGCEFGIFQRECGAEPLGLLRWADLNHIKLTDALNARFEGVGDPANTEVIVPHPDGDAEYWTRDRRYWMAMRCFVRADTIPQERMEVRACQRLKYLRRKLIEDLEEGSKLFVFKNMFRDLTEEELDNLHRAVRSYGANTTLFYVRYANIESPAGTVRLVKPGLIVGHIAHFAFSPADEQLPPATQHWLALCKAALAVWRDETVTSDTEIATTGVEEPTKRELVMHFESLGAIEGGCEFGLVQRAFGAEPLGLLRWTEIWPDKLIAALECEFAGVGDPAHTELVVTPSSTGPGEYQTRDHRFGMRMHTFVEADKIAPDTMLERSCRRLRFLRGKMLEDLRAADKVFVYKMTMRNLTPSEINQLHTALRKYGPTTLLYVQYEDAAHPNGTVQIAGPGLMIGYIDRFNVTPEGEASEPALGSWEAICRRAYALWAPAETAQGIRPPASVPIGSTGAIPTGDLDAAGYSAAAHSLRENQQWDEAEALLVEGIERHPDHAGLLVDYASIAQERRTWPQALERWERLQRDVPNDLRGYVGAAVALREMQRPDEADRPLAAAIKQFPGNSHPSMHYASFAQQRGDLSEALLRWAHVRKNFPGETVAYVHAAVALRDLNRLDEADALLQEVIERFPDRQEPMIYHAAIAEHRQDWPEALRRWSRAREQFPDDRSSYLRATDILRQQGRFDEAEAIVAEAVERFPSDQYIVFEAADLATQREDWALALARWQEARRRFPDDPRIESRIYIVQMRMIEADPNTVESPPLNVASARTGPDADDATHRPHETEPPTARARQDADDTASRLDTTESPMPTESEIKSTEQDQPPQIKPGRVGRVLKTLSSRMRGTSFDASRR